ncbi:MAG: (Na+)-NQR maturation NqrM [Planctomycetes bacterium]|nr:(Na+)-NQR maturation NqrM [Planctomycetota bacterium]
MWQTFLFAGIVFALALTGMAIGVILSNRRLKGSCGGLANMKDSQGKTVCEGCTNPSPECAGESLEKW